jgi:hypothetical protein
VPRVALPPAQLLQPGRHLLLGPVLAEVAEPAPADRQEAALAHLVPEAGVLTGREEPDALPGIEAVDDRARGAQPRGLLSPLGGRDPLAVGARRGDGLQPELLQEVVVEVRQRCAREGRERLVEEQRERRDGLGQVVALVEVQVLVVEQVLVRRADAAQLRLVARSLEELVARELDRARREVAQRDQVRREVRPVGAGQADEVGAGRAGGDRHAGEAPVVDQVDDGSPGWTSRMAE